MEVVSRCRRIRFKYRSGVTQIHPRDKFTVGLRRAFLFVFQAQTSTVFHEHAVRVFVLLFK